MTRPQPKSRRQRTQEIIDTERSANARGGRTAANGKPSGIMLMLEAQEAQLIAEVMQNGQFPSPLAKQVAASIQTKLMQQMPNENEGQAQANG